MKAIQVIKSWEFEDCGQTSVDGYPGRGRRRRDPGKEQESRTTKKKIKMNTCAQSYDIERGLLTSPGSTAPDGEKTRRRVGGVTLDHVDDDAVGAAGGGPARVVAGVPLLGHGHGELAGGHVAHRGVHRDAPRPPVHQAVVLVPQNQTWNIEDKGN